MCPVAGQQAELQRVLCDDEQEEGGGDLRGGSRRPRGYIKHILNMMD